MQDDAGKIVCFFSATYLRVLNIFSFSHPLNYIFDSSYNNLITLSKQCQVVS